MKITILSFILIGITVATVSFSSIIKYQQQLRDRVLIVFAPDHSSQLYKQQLKVLKNNHEGMIERDIVFYSIFDLSGIDPEKNPLSESKVDSIRRVHQVPNADFTVLLIGKDGTEKMRSHKVVSAQELFALVDAMPTPKNAVQHSKHVFKP